LIPVRKLVERAILDNRIDLPRAGLSRKERESVPHLQPIRRLVVLGRALEE
jgi:hypothetical protein